MSVSRRPRTGFARRDGFRGIGGGSSTAPLLSLSDALFGRVDEGSYITSASSATWYAADTVRDGSRGVLIEGERKNYLLRSRWLTASWSGAGTPAGSIVAGSASAGDAPDGTTAAQITLGLSTTSQITQTIGAANGPVNGDVCTAQVFVKLVSGDGQAKLRVVGKDGVSNDLDFTATSSWQKLELQVNVGTGASGVICRIINRNAASTQVIKVWGFCFYNAKWARTPTEHTSSTAVTAYADSLSWLPAWVPQRLREGRTSWTIAPHFAPADLSSGNTFWIFTLGFGATDGLRVRHTGTDVRVEAVTSSTVRASSPALTGSTREQSRVVVVDPASGVITVDGVAGATGTAWTWPGGVDLSYGGTFNNGNEFDGYIKLPEVA